MTSRASEFRRGRHVVYNLNVHLVFITKYRKRCLTKRVTSILEDSFRKVCGDFGVTLKTIGWEPNHVHLLISYPPKVALSALVNSLKGVSSRRLRDLSYPKVKRALWGNSFWSPSYCAISAGGAPLEQIKRYIESQEGPISSPP
jgi:putative transposase